MHFAKVIFSTAALSLAVTSPAAAEFKRIKNEKQMLQLVAGKKLVSDAGYSFIYADGTLKGKFNGQNFSGSWLWSGRFWCRNGVLGGQEIGSDCQVWEIDGDKLRYTRKKGKGDAVVATLE